MVLGVSPLACRQSLKHLAYRDAVQTVVLNGMNEASKKKKRRKEKEGKMNKKEQLQESVNAPHSSILHGTILVLKPHMHTYHMAVPQRAAQHLQIQLSHVSEMGKGDRERSGELVAHAVLTHVDAHLLFARIRIL